MSSSEEEVSSSGEEVSSSEEEDYVTEEDLVQREKRAKNIFRDFQIRSQLPFRKGQSVEETDQKIEDFFQLQDNVEWLKDEVARLKWDDSTFVSDLLRIVLTSDLLAERAWSSERDKKKPQLPLPLVQFLRSVVTTAVEEKAESRGKDKVAKAKARQELMAKAIEQLKKRFVSATQRCKRAAEDSKSDNANKSNSTKRSNNSKKSKNGKKSNKVKKSKTAASVQKRQQEAFNLDGGGQKEPEQPQEEKGPREAENGVQQEHDGGQRGEGEVAGLEQLVEVVEQQEGDDGVDQLEEDKEQQERGKGVEQMEEVKESEQPQEEKGPGPEKADNGELQEQDREQKEEGEVKGVEQLAEVVEQLGGGDGVNQLGEVDKQKLEVNEQQGLGVEQLGEVEKQLGEVEEQLGEVDEQLGEVDEQLEVEDKENPEEAEKQQEEDEELLFAIVVPDEAKVELEQDFADGVKVVRQQQQPELLEGNKEAEVVRQEAKEVEEKEVEEKAKKAKSQGQTKKGVKAADKRKLEGAVRGSGARVEKRRTTMIAVGDEIKVVWKSTVYKAKVTKERTNAKGESEYRVHYVRYKASQDEWINGSSKRFSF